MSIENFDLENIYDEMISPLMSQIVEICKENKMPMVASFAFRKTDEDGLGTCTTVLNANENRIIPEFTESVRIIQKKSAFIAMTIIKGLRDDN